MANSLRILLLSAYDAASHRRWHTRLVEQFPEYQWTTLTLPPRFFSWRFRGNPLSLAYEHSELWNEQWDLIVATSMVDLSTLRGLIPALSQTPTLLYVHENQFAYPIMQKQVQRDVFHNCMLNLYSALSAQRVVFNSHYNRNTFLDGARQMLKRMPDCVPAGVVDFLEQRCSVLPVPLEADCYQESRAEGPLRIVWNHRWEYDKAPERFFDALRLLQDEGVPFRLRMLGQRFQKIPKVFAEAETQFREHIDVWGFVESKQAYLKELATADVVVSTALHEFQGLAVLEAVASGCYPMLPDRLAYSELFDKRWLYPSFPDEPEKEVQELAKRLKRMASGVERLRSLPVPDVSGFSWEQKRDEYRNLLEETANSSLPLFFPPG
jgi:glycosyltransferase involved in cell wall biosynthesis